MAKKLTFWFAVMRSWRSHNHRGTELRCIKLTCDHVQTFYWSVSSDRPRRRLCRECRSDHFAIVDWQENLYPCACGRCRLRK